MKTFENLQAEVEKIGKKSKATSAKIDLEERSINYSGIETFDADLVINELNRLATFHENLCIKNSKMMKDLDKKGEGSENFQRLVEDDDIIKMLEVILKKKDENTASSSHQPSNQDCGGR